MRVGDLCRALLLLLLLAGGAVPMPPRMCQTCTLLIGAIGHVTTFSTSREDPVIDNAGVANSLMQKLEVALNAGMAGRENASVNIVAAFQQEVAAQAGHHISPGAASILDQDAMAIMAAARNSD